MRGLTQRSVMVVILLAVIILTGCMGTGSKGDLSSLGSVDITIPIPTEVMILGLNGEDQPALDQIVVRVVKGSQEKIQEIPIEGETVKVSFTGLDAGTWDIFVDVWDTEEYIVFKGTVKVIIRAQEKTSATVVLLPNDATFSVTFEVSDRIEASRAHVSLVVGTNMTSSMFYDIVDHSFVFGGWVGAGTWPLHISLLNSNGDPVFEWNGSITTKTGRHLERSITIESGDGLEIGFEWITIPQPPQEVDAIVQGNNVYLSWQPNHGEIVEGYRVFRSTSLSETPLPLVRYSVLTSPEFTDINPEPGNTYWYYVVSYNSAGQGSKLSQPVSVTIEAQGEFAVEPPILIYMNGKAGNSIGDMFIRCPYIMFSPSSSPNVMEYRFYRSLDSPDNFQFYKSIGPYENSVADHEPSWGKTHYYYITAVNDQGLESMPSEIVNFTLTQPLQILNPLPNLVFQMNDTLVLQWNSEEDFDSYSIYAFVGSSKWNGPSFYAGHGTTELEIVLSDDKFSPGTYRLWIDYAEKRIGDFEIIVSNSEFITFVITE